MNGFGFNKQPSKIEHIADPISQRLDIISRSQGIISQLMKESDINKTEPDKSLMPQNTPLINNHNNPSGDNNNDGPSEIENIYKKIIEDIYGQNPEDFTN